MAARPRSRDRAAAHSRGKMLVLGVFCAAVAPQGARAQYHGVPLSHMPSQRLADHWTVAVASGGGLNAESGKNFGAVAEASRRFGGRLTVAAGLGVLSANQEVGGRVARAQGGGRLALRLNPADQDPSLNDYVAVSVIAGAGVARFGAGAGEVNLPLGVGVAYYFNLIGKGPWQQVWAVPKYAPRILDVGAASGFQSGAGFSGGFNLGFSRAVGIGVGIDWTRFGDVTIEGVDIEGSDRVTLGGFVRFRL